jgi:hypothetical protein
MWIITQKINITKTKDQFNQLILTIMDFRKFNKFSYLKIVKFSKLSFLKFSNKSCQKLQY